MLLPLFASYPEPERTRGKEKSSAVLNEYPI
jgi:hypothetical protein